MKGRKITFALFQDGQVDLNYCTAVLEGPPENINYVITCNFLKIEAYTFIFIIFLRSMPGYPSDTIVWQFHLTTFLTELQLSLAQVSSSPWT